MATGFVHFHNNKFKFLYCLAGISVSLKAKHSVGSRDKAPGQGVSRGTKST